MSGASSNRKGKEGERELARYLTSQGWDAERDAQQYRGSGRDIECHDLGRLHNEGKRRKKQLDPYGWIEQAKRDMQAGQIPTVWMRRDRHEWLVVLRADDFCELLRNCDADFLKGET